MKADKLAALLAKATDKTQSAAAEAERRGDNLRWLSEDIGEIRDRLAGAATLEISTEGYALLADLFCSLGKIGKQMRKGGAS